MSETGPVNQNDVLAENLLNKIDPSIRQSFTPEQLTAIRKVIQENWPKKKKHLYDVHSTISLLIKRFYFVFSVGKDTRSEAEEIDIERRTKTSPRDVIISALVVTGFLGLLILVYYVLPS